MYYEKYNQCKPISAQRIMIDRADQEVKINLELNRNNRDSNGILCGKVTDQQGEPIQYATVKLVTDTYDPAFQTKTDSKGNYFIFDIPAHKCHKLIAVAEHYELSEEIKICLIAQEVLKINILLSNRTIEAGIITGTVFNKINFLPLNKAHVILFEDNGEEELAKEFTVTNELGQYAFTRLALGKYSIKTSMSGFLSEQYGVTITDDTKISNHVVSLLPDNTKPKGVVYGIITDQDQMPIPEADVILYKVGYHGNITPIAYTRANHDGVYLFINIETGSYKVMAI